MRRELATLGVMAERSRPSPGLVATAAPPAARRTPGGDCVSTERRNVGGHRPRGLHHGASRPG